MPASVRRFCIESLEDRRYAAATPAAVFKFPSVSYDASGSIYVDGSIGDDRMTVRYLKRSLYLEIATAFNHSAIAGNVGQGSIAIDPTHTRVENTFARTADDGRVLSGVQTFVIPLAGHLVVTIEGSDGSDTVIAKQIPINVVATQVESPAITPAPAAAGATPSDPTTGSLYGSPPAWAEKLRRQLKAVKTSGAEIAFFGDSHADRFEYYGRGSWNAAFPKALNLGTGGDNTRNMLYRIRAGLFDRYKPKTIVVMAGTNDLNNSATDGTDDQVYKGITDVIAALRRKVPTARIVLFSIFPRGESGLNMRIQTINARVRALAERSGTFEFLNFYDRLADTFGEHDLMNLDNHLSAAGYRVLTRYLTAFLRDDPRDVIGPIQAAV